MTGVAFMIHSPGRDESRLARIFDQNIRISEHQDIRTSEHDTLYKLQKANAMAKKQPGMLVTAK